MAGRPSFSSSSSSSFSYGWKYDVFLSFRGQDTRFGFTGNLYKALHDKGIHTFIDDGELQRGDEITPSLLKAIKESRIAIPIFSQNYASSSFCLDELVNIIHCIKAKGRLVLPVFYDVDPSDVRHQRGSYGQAMARHEERFFKYDKENLKDNIERLNKWKMALKQAANLSGEHFKLWNEYEHEFIEKIVKLVSKKINRVPLHVADYPVGLESRVLQVNSHLDVGSDDVVHMVGIHGIGGMGKTTLARALYNSIADQFEGLCFLDDVREISIKHGIVHLQETLLSEIVGEKNIKLGSVNKGIPIIKQRLHRKKVLLILDDVDKLDQLRAIVGGLDWFGSGSRVIITTRDKHLLTSHEVERKYEVDGLNEREAIDLLIWKAFKSDKVLDPSLMDILNRAVAYTSGLPLALEVIGSNLFGKSIEEWKSALDLYEIIPNKDIQKTLKVSFDALEEYQQSVFLDIACCFKGYELAKVEHILCAHHGMCPKFGIGVLVEKSLIKIQGGRMKLHDLIEDMGKEIVRQESPKEPGKRSRLWFPEDVVQVLERNTGTSDIEIINMDFAKFEEEVTWDGEAFKKMENLKTLIIKSGHFSEGPKHLPNSLRVLEWWGYPSQSLPSYFHPEKLAIFELPNCCLKSLRLFEKGKKFVNLSVLNFSGSKWITQIPDVSCVPNLENLSFENCENLIKIHESVGFLDKLRIVSGDGCKRLSTFPPLMLPSLEKLRLSRCSSLEDFPEILGKMENIIEIFWENTPIKELPFSIQNLTRLREINLRFDRMLRLPRLIVMLPKHKVLTVWGCKELQLSKQDEGEEKLGSMLSSIKKHLGLEFGNLSNKYLSMVATLFANVEELCLLWNGFTILPASIKECRLLRKLVLDNCKDLREIRGIPPNIETLSATWCTSLKDLDLTLLPAGTKECRFLRKLYLTGCENFQEIRGIPPNIEILYAQKCPSLTSWCKSMLLNEELHKTGNKLFWLPERRIPVWFEHHRRGWGESISFWFRNKFPAISLCLDIRTDDHFLCFQIHPCLIINGKKKFATNEEFHLRMWNVTGHILIFGLKNLIKLEDNVDEVLLENEWNHAVFYIDDNDWVQLPFDSNIRFHVSKQKSSMEDIQFTNPYERDDDNVNWGSKSMISTQISSSTTVQGCKIVPRKKEVVLGSDSVISSLASDTASDGGLREQQHLTSIDQQQNFEGYESVNKAKGKGMVSLAVACNSNAGEDNGISPLMEQLSMTKEYQVTSEKYQPPSYDKAMAWDLMELEYQVTYPEDQFVSNDESTLSVEGCHVMESNQRTGKWQFCLCALFSSLLSLCSSSSSLDTA